MNAEVWPEGSRANIRLVRNARTPGHRTRILVIDRDPNAVVAIRNVLKAEDWEVISARTGAEGLEKARQEGPDAVLTELTLGDMNGVELCRTLRGRTDTASTPIIVLSGSSGVAERVASLRAGAFDYLVKPADPEELIARLKAALDLRKEKAGFVTAVIGGKGGVGTSVLAVNLATALRRETHSGVALLDAALGTGTIDIMLNLRANRGVSHLLTQLEELEAGDFEAILTPHATGVQVLLLQEQGVDAIQPEEMRQILIALRRLRDLVVVDTPPPHDENTATILEVADRVLLVVTPEIPALRGARLFLQQASQMGLSRERIMLVLNRFPQRGGLQRHAIETALGMAAQATIADDTKLVTYSINRGVPLTESHGRSPVARQISKLASDLAKAAQQQ